MSAAHALLSPSAAERWIHCPGSVQLTRDMPDKGSPYAAAGTLAHAVAELKLQKAFGCGGALGPKTYSTRLNKFKKAPEWEPEMDSCTDAYLEFITDTANALQSRPFVTAEHRLDLSAFAPESFGTADCVLIHDGALHVIDFKYGAGVAVSAAQNPQLMLYALGAAAEYAPYYAINTARMSIVQPRAGGISTYEMPLRDLEAWAEQVVRPAAEKALDPQCAEYKSGVWCRWCKAQPTCRTRATDVTDAVAEFAPRAPALLTSAEFGALLDRLAPLLSYAALAKDYALEQLLLGEAIPGWKLVEGRQPRVWDDQDAAFDTLKTGGVEEALLYHREPYSLAQIEKSLGKSYFKQLAGAHVVRTQGKPTLAPEADTREAYSPQPSAADDFAPENKGA